MIETGGEQETVEACAQHVLVTARSVGRRTRVASLDADDFFSIGMIALIEAHRKFDATKGAQFWTYADKRVRGAMLDAARSAHFGSRQTHAHLESLDTLSTDTDVECQDRNVKRKTLRAEATQFGDAQVALLRRQIARLRERERFIIEKHDLEGYSMKEIGAGLGLTESRISQIRTAAINKIRKQWGIAA